MATRTYKESMTRLHEQVEKQRKSLIYWRAMAVMLGIIAVMQHFR